MRCNQCGLDCPDNSRFCPGCGTMFAAQPTKPAYQQPAYQQPAYQQPAYQQNAYQQPVYQQPAKNTNKLILWIVIGVIVAAGIGVGLFFLLRGKDSGGTATQASVSGTYYLESVNGKSVYDYFIGQFTKYGYSEAQAIAELQRYGVDMNNMDNAVYFQLNEDGTVYCGGTLISLFASGSTSGVWKLEDGNKVTIEINGAATFSYSNGKLSGTNNGNAVVYSKRG